MDGIGERGLVKSNWLGEREEKADYLRVDGNVVTFLVRHTWMEERWDFTFSSELRKQMDLTLGHKRQKGGLALRQRSENDLEPKIPIRIEDNAAVLRRCMSHIASPG